MKSLSEETLNAYADGALEETARAEVEAQLETDAEARALLDRLRAADRLMIEAFAAPMHESPPQALVDTILGAREPRAADRYASFLGRWQAPAWSARRYALALAASLALVVGLATGAFLANRWAEPTGELALGLVPGKSVLHRLLEIHPSGGILDLATAQGAPTRRIAVVATFMDRHARPCREVEVLSAGADPHPVAAGVACRDTLGRWRIEGATLLAGAPPASDAQFEPSGVPEKDALDGLLTLLGAQRALDHAAEKALIERGWQR